MASHKFVVCLLVAAVCLLSAASADEQRSHLIRKRQIPSSSAAVDAALRNPRFVRRHISCLLAESPCDNIGRSLKRKFYHSRTSFPCCPTYNFLLVFFFSCRSRDCVWNDRNDAFTATWTVSRMFERPVPAGDESDDVRQSPVSGRIQPHLLLLHTIMTLEDLESGRTFSIHPSHPLC